MAWRVLDQGALTRWLETNPAPELVDAVAAWIAQCRRAGPPDDCIRVFLDDDVFIARVPSTQLTARYRVIAFEQLILLNDIG